MPVDPSNGGLSLSPLPGDVRVQSGQQEAYAKVTCQDLMDYCIPSWLTRRYLRCTHSTYVFNEVCIGLLMGFGFIGSRPLHLVPLFHPFPFTHFFFFSFLSCLPVFMFCHFIAFLLRAHFRSPRSLQFPMRWVLIGCPCALIGSLSFPPHTPLSGLVSSSCLHSFVFLRTHSHICPDLSASCLPSGRRVCV